MSFGENLKTIRKEKHLSQEELAELLEVSRQSVSKWEQDAGYPEAEKLIQLSRTLNVSLDALLETGFAPGPASNEISFHGSIVITSPHENVITECYKVSSSGRMPGGKDEDWCYVPLVSFKSEYKVHVRECAMDDIEEIDTYDELCAIDPSYLSYQK